MKIARIKDRYMFHSRSWNTNKSHDYLIFKDNSSNEIRAIQLTHLYKKDRHRFMQVRISNKQKNDVIRFYNRPNEKKTPHLSVVWTIIGFAINIIFFY